MNQQPEQFLLNYTEEQTKDFIKRIDAIFLAVVKEQTELYKLTPQAYANMDSEAFKKSVLVAIYTRIQDTISNEEAKASLANFAFKEFVKFAQFHKAGSNIAKALETLLNLSKQ